MGNEYKIAVIYIGIGRYEVLWDEFYESAEKYFFSGSQKHYFVFTDSKRISDYYKKDNISIINEKNYGWPGNTLYRYAMFEKIEKMLNLFDYVYFFNANAKFVKTISIELIPPKNTNLIVAEHFRARNMHPLLRGYDRNKKSTAYVKWGCEGENYIQACFIGATSYEFVKLSKTLAENVRTDDKNNVVAKWHDESHLNKYIIGKPYTLLSVSYVYPEILNLPIEINILMRDKEKYSDLSVLRYGKKSVFKTIKNKLLNQIDKIERYFHYITMKRRLKK